MTAGTVSNSSPISAFGGSDNIRQVEDDEDAEKTLHKTPLEETDPENDAHLSEKSDCPPKSSHRICSSLTEAHYGGDITVWLWVTR
jgi:hypothetical protein